jgi:4'-phosphopantetheinyl transferase
MTADECTVWWARVSMLRPWHSDLLDPTERARRDQYRQDADRARFTLGVALLRVATADVLAMDPVAVPVRRHCPNCSGAHGRPEIGDSDLHVSVSHSGDMVAVALTRVAPVGVDVETMSGRVDIDLVAGQVMGDGERAAGPHDFFVYWTRKESAVKATGDGLRVPLRQVLVSAPDEPARLLSYAGRLGLAATMADLRPDDGYRAALTVLRAEPPVLRERDATALLGGGG